MAQVNAFNAALTRIGFNNATAEAMFNEGFDTLEVLMEIEESDIDAMIKNIRETRRLLGANAPGNVTFPFLAIKYFKAMHNWALELRRMGRPLNSGLYVGAVIANAVACYYLESLRTATLEDKVVDKPKELLDLTKWETFWEQWKTYIHRTRGAPKCPLSYVFQEHDAVTNEMHLAAYIDHDDRLVNTTVLTGPWFELDNQRVYEKFKVLILKGPGWSFIKSYDRAKNGRAAVLALRRQCKGTSAIQSRKASAYAKIIAARYNSQRKTFTFNNYVEAHQGTHNTLTDLGEAVPETKKVNDFLAGFTDPCLSGAKDLVLGDAQKLQDFESCQQYFKTLVYNKTTQEHHEHQISGLKQVNSNNKRVHTEDKQQEITSRTYSREEWSKLSNEQREKVKELRKRKKPLRAEHSTSRNASAIEHDPDEQSDGAESDNDTESIELDKDEEKDQQPGSVTPTRRSGRAVGSKRG
jgi:hypothetical protein